jgi:hypothetical protein
MRLPLATDLISRDGTVDQDAKLLNAYGGEDACKRPGSVDLGTILAGVAQNLDCWNDVTYCFTDDTLKTATISGSTATVVTTAAMLPVTADAMMQSITNGAGRATQQMMIKSPTQAWIYTP